MTTAYAPLRALLARLEVSDCDCPLDLQCPCGESCAPENAAYCVHCRGECDCPPCLWQPPCRHILDADHNFPLDEWAAVLWETDPAEYVEPFVWPPERFQPTLALSPSALVAVMARREANGEPLRHPDDYVYRADREHGAMPGHLRNGEDSERGVA